MKDFPDNKPYNDLIPWVIQSNNKHKRDIDELQNELHVTPWITPDLLNSYGAPPSPMTVVKYRWHFKTHALEFIGHLDVASAVTDTVAFSIVDALRPAYDKSWLTDVTSGITFYVARVYITAATGDVTLTWPVSTF